jgi:hypothetical protein
LKSSGLNTKSPFHSSLIAGDGLGDLWFLNDRAVTVLVAYVFGFCGPGFES